MRINHNMLAINTHRQLGGVGNMQAKSMEKLSSGYRINRAGDDAAGLAISEKMRAQIRGLQTASKNAQDGVSLVQTAEGALQEVHSMLNRMVELATQSANGTYQNETDRENLQKEVKALKDEINRVAESANFNGIKLLDGSLSSRPNSTTIDTAVDDKMPKVVVKVPNTAGTVIVEKPVTADKKSKMEFDITNVVSLNATDGGKSLEFQFAYKDSAGKEHEIKFNLVTDDANTGTPATYTAGDKIKTISYTIDGANATTITSSGSEALGSAASDQAKFIKEQLLDKVSDITTNFDLALDGGKIVATAKTEGNVANRIVVTTTLDTAQAGTKLQNIAGTEKNTAADLDPKTTLKTANMASIGSTTKSSEYEKSIVEVNGVKFAFVQNGAVSDKKLLEALKGMGVEAKNIIATAGTSPAEADTKNLVEKVNKHFGQEIAKVDTTTATDVIFTKSEKALPVVDTSNPKGLILQVGDTNESFQKLAVSIESMSVDGLKLTDVDVSDQEKAATSIAKIKAAINTVSSTRGDLGALQNRLEHTISNIDTMAENIQASEARIRDVDMAKEIVELTKANILQQAAQSMLAQANQAPQGVLQLLR